MTLNEATRHQLHEAARAAFGDDAAVTLMEMLPPVGWADVATKRDLDHLEERIDTRFEQMDTRLFNFEERMDLRMDAKLAKLQNRMTMWFVGVLVAIAIATGFLNLT